MPRALKRWTNWYRPHRTFGRFTAMRSAYSWLKASQGATNPELEDVRPTLFPTLSAEASRADLHSQGLHTGFHLPDAMIEPILSFAKSAPCTRPGFDESFKRDEVHEGRLPDGRPAAMGDVRQPMECKQIGVLCRDPGLLAAAQGFLGYRPERIEVRLFWSFTAKLADDLRRTLRQTIDFHYDVPWFNVVYAYFYLTPTDRHSGAHVMYRGTARNKPLRFVMGASFRDEAELAAFYGTERKLVVEGPAGFGFLVDPFGFHRALPPVNHDRLMLQIRYY